MRTWLVCFLLAAPGFTQTQVDVSIGPAQQPPPRDARATTVEGSAVIRGRITAADTGAPMRRATVNLSGGAGGRPRMVYTDHDGRYAFTKLPPGTYSLMAMPGNHRATYQAASYGSSVPFTPGRRIDLTDAQTLDNIDVALPRAAAITGRVTDPAGEPAARVQVSAMLLRPGAQPSQAGFASTDDLGHFRLFALQPGEYIVVAEARGGGGPMDTEGEVFGFVRSYAPGTPRRDDAQRIRLARGGEASVEIRMAESQVFTVSGTVINAQGEPLRSAGISLHYPDSPGSSAFGAGIGPNGVFTIRNVPPGQYELIARYMPAIGPEGPQRAGPPQGQEIGVVRVDVSTANVENVSVVTSRGETFTGEIVLEDGPAEKVRASINMQVPERTSYGIFPQVEVKGETFTVRGAFGPLLVRGSVGTGPPPRLTPPPPGTPLVTIQDRPMWTLKAVLLDGKDITDVPTVFTAAHSGRVKVVFTSRTGTIDGVVTDDSGKPPRGASLLLFGQDEEGWVPFSSRNRSTFVQNDDGKFTLRGLREGRYYIVAVEPGQVFASPMGFDRTLLEVLKKLATPVVLNAGEARTVDLRVTRIE